MLCVFHHTALRWTSNVVYHIVGMLRGQGGTFLPNLNVPRMSKSPLRLGSGGGHKTVECSALKYGLVLCCTVRFKVLHQQAEYTALQLCSGPVNSGGRVEATLRASFCVTPITSTRALRHLVIGYFLAGILWKYKKWQWNWNRSSKFVKCTRDFLNDFK